ncbi:hypothetical protein Btru_001130 [Bulinus truncatus]|nr:hypothetical protein Btru_001130 [Bulinus truncatus]
MKMTDFVSYPVFESSKMNGTTRLKIGDINKNLICVLCGGYLIDATTIIECLHSFCRTCIVTFLKTSRTCPVCDTVVHKTRPHQNIRSDKLLQDLVYKLVPGLYKDEMRRRREFYTVHYEAAPKRAGEERGDEMSDRFTFTEEETISLALYLCPNGGNERSGLHRVFAPKEDLKTRMDRRIKESVDVRYLQCKAAVTVGLLKKFLRLKYSLPDHFLIDITYNDETLRDCYTLCDVAYTFNWRRRAPLLMTFCVYEGEKPHPYLVESVSYRQYMALPESKIKVEKDDNVVDKSKLETVLAASNLSSSTTPKGPAPPPIVTHSVQKKLNKPSKSKVTLSDPTTSTSVSEKLDVQPSSSGVCTKQTQPDLSALPSTSKCKTVTPGTSKSKKSDKRKSVNDITPSEGSSSKKKRKLDKESAKVASQSGQLNLISSSQTVSWSAKCASDAPLVLTILPSTSVSGPVTSKPNLLLSQPVVSSSSVVGVPTSQPSSLSLALANCTVTPSLYSNPTLSLSVASTKNNTNINSHNTYNNSHNTYNNRHNTYNNSIVNHLHTTLATTSVVSQSKTTVSSSPTPPTPSSVNVSLSSSTASLSQAPSTMTHSVLRPFTTSATTASSTLTQLSAPSTMTSLSNTTPFVSSITKVSQKSKKTTVDPDSHNKNVLPSLKRPASSPVPIAPAPAKLQKLAPPPAVDIAKLIKFNSDVHPPGVVIQPPLVSPTVAARRQPPLVCPTAAGPVKSLVGPATAPVKSLVCPTAAASVKSKSSRVASNNKTITPTTTLKFSVSSLLSSNPGKSSLVSVTTTLANTGLFTHVDSLKGPIDQSVMMGGLSLHPATKSKITSKAQIVNTSQQSSNQLPPKTCQSVPPLQTNSSGSFDSTASVSATSIASPTPASSASPTPAAVPVQQSQTQGSDSDLTTSIKQEPEQKTTQVTVSDNFVPAINDSKIPLAKNLNSDKVVSATNSDKTVPGVKVSDVKLMNSEHQLQTVSSVNTTLTPRTSLPSPLPFDGRSPSAVSNSAPELNGSVKVPALSPTNISCPLRKQASSQKKKIADIANTLLQNQNSKGPQVIINARKNLQKSAANVQIKATANTQNKAAANMRHLNCSQLNHEFYLGVVNGQTLQNFNLCQGSLGGSLTNAASDEPLNLVKRKEVTNLPNTGENTAQVFRGQRLHISVTLGDKKKTYPITATKRCHVTVNRSIFRRRECTIIDSRSSGDDQYTVSCTLT